MRLSWMNTRSDRSNRVGSTEGEDRPVKIRIRIAKVSIGRSDGSIERLRIFNE